MNCQPVVENCCNGTNNFVFIIVLYILLVIILGSCMTAW